MDIEIGQRVESLRSFLVAEKTVADSYLNLSLFLLFEFVPFSSHNLPDFLVPSINEQNLESWGRLKKCQSAADFLDLFNTSFEVFSSKHQKEKC